MSGRQQPTELLAARAYLAVRDRILKLELAPSSAINEDALVSELGVGRTPIREAIKRLSMEGLIVIYPRRGTFVTDINITDLGSISELRQHLEGYAAEKAAQASAADRAGAQSLIDEINERCSEPCEVDVLMDLDGRVHRLIYELSGNPFLATTTSHLYHLSVRIWNLVRNRLPSVGDAVKEHRGLLEAIRDGKPQDARDLAEAHVSNFAERIHRVL